MTEVAPQNDRWRLRQSFQRSPIEIAAASIRSLLGKLIPSRRELMSLAPLKRGLLLGLAALTALALITPIAAILSLELAIASQSAVRGGRAPMGPESRSAGSFENILQRPLFSRNRQLLVVAAPPVIVDAPAPAGRAMLDPSVALRGVFMNGERAKAFLTSSDNPAGVWIAMNEQWSGWLLSEVKPNEVVLEANGERQTLPLTVLK
ncbi:hypothetical protein ACWAUC_11900 [Bradyrhizobium guangdongense]